MFKKALVLSLLFISSQSYSNEQNTALEIIEEVCQHCHGMEGEASNLLYPRLAGQNKKYMVKQLTDFRSGKRQAEPMNDMSAKLKDNEIEALATYFSAKPTQSHRVSVRKKDFAQVGQYIFKKGNKYSGVPACSTCHGEKGEGSDKLPRLAGQHKRYVADQLKRFNERARNNDNAIMHSVASKLTEFEIHAVALYVSGIK